MQPSLSPSPKGAQQLQPRNGPMTDFLHGFIEGDRAPRVDLIDDFRGRLGNSASRHALVGDAAMQMAFLPEGGDDPEYWLDSASYHWQEAVDLQDTNRNAVSRWTARAMMGLAVAPIRAWQLEEVCLPPQSLVADSFTDLLKATDQIEAQRIEHMAAVKANNSTEALRNALSLYGIVGELSVVLMLQQDYLTDASSSSMLAVPSLFIEDATGDRDRGLPAWDITVLSNGNTNLENDRLAQIKTRKRQNGRKPNIETLDENCDDSNDRVVTISIDPDLTTMSEKINSRGVSPQKIVTEVKQRIESPKRVNKKADIRVLRLKNLLGIS